MVPPARPARQRHQDRAGQLAKCGCRTRQDSPNTAIARQAATPSLFSHIAQPASRYLALPEVSSENRDYLPGMYYDANVIATNKLIVWPNAPLWLFGVVQS